MNIATQLHTALPRPGGVSGTITAPASSNVNTSINSASSMEAVNRSRSQVDPLASVTANDNLCQEESGELPADPVPVNTDVYMDSFLDKIR